MAAAIIDGKIMAAAVRREVRAAADSLAAESGLAPGLAVILVGDDPASRIYVRNKAEACAEVGIISHVHNLPAETAEETVADLIGSLNENDAVDGILLQLPLPAGKDEERLLQMIRPDKDVDGLHPENTGKLLLGAGGLLPCTPQGVIEMLQRSGVEINGKRAVMVGRSNIVGKPMALLLLQNNATITVCHSRTRDLAAVTREADILVAAVGKPEFIKKEMVKPGAVVIDVGMNRVGKALAGDVDFDAVSGVAGMITPVPGGVGPMTIAMLLKNTMQAAKLRRGLK